MLLRSVHKSPFDSLSYDNQFPSSRAQLTGKHTKHTKHKTTCRRGDSNILSVCGRGHTNLAQFWKPPAFFHSFFCYSHRNGLRHVQTCMLLDCWPGGRAVGRSDGMWSCDLDTSLNKQINGTKGSSISPLESAARCLVSAPIQSETPDTLKHANRAQINTELSWILPVSTFPQLPVRFKGLLHLRAPRW